MGLVETIVEHVSIKMVLLGPLVLLTVYHVFLYVSETIRVRRLGIPGYQIKTRVPFGELPPYSTGSRTASLPDAGSTDSTDAARRK